MIIGMAQAVSLQLDLQRTELERAQTALEREARIWDDTVAERSETWLQELSSSENVSRRERTYREQVTWFEAVYLWRRSPGGSPQWVHPRASPEEDLPAMNAAPCVSRARRLSGTVRPTEVPELYRACANDPDLRVRLFASTEAATRLLVQGRANEAQLALSETGIGDMDLSAAAGLGIAPKRMTIRRALNAEAIAAVGRDRIASSLYESLGREIVLQDGSALEQALPFLEHPVLSSLRSLGEDEVVAELEAERETALVRLEAWREVRDGLAPRAEPGDELRVVHDQYGQHYMLVYSELDEGYFGAVQLDEDALIRELLVEAEDRKHILVKSAFGDAVLGVDEPTVVETAFPRMLAHLRLGYGKSYMVAAKARYRSNLLSQIMPVLVGAIIGIVAIFARVTADRREVELLERQREFATRVTHELKTPLAGIRVMAENLELGATDATTSAQFAGRIISEADKLTARIDEVLAVARSRTPARPAPYQLDDDLEGILDEWEPRMDDAGVTLTRDIKHLPPCRGDAPLVRDAVVCLLDNALKYRRTDRRDSQVKVRLRRDGRWAVLDVVDNGIGVPAAKRKVIFEPFARVEGPGRGRSGGHGLGLSFVADAMRAQGGRVECHAGMNGGARFTIRLPLSRR